MNSTGEIPAQERFKCADFISLQRLVVQFELFNYGAPCEGPFPDHAAPRAHIYFGLEKSIGPASIGPGPIERHIGVLQQNARFRSIDGRNGNTDSDVGYDLMAVDLVRPDDRVADATHIDPFELVQV